MVKTVETKTENALEKIRHHLDFIQDVAIPDALDDRNYELVAAYVSLLNKTDAALDDIQKIRRFPDIQVCLISEAEINQAYEG